MTNELNDLRREREILADELLEAKNAFANDIKDTLGEQIKRELTKKTAEVKEKVEAPQKGAFKRFLDNITRIFV